MSTFEERYALEKRRAEMNVLALGMILFFCVGCAFCCLAATLVMIQ